MSGVQYGPMHMSTTRNYEVQRTNWFYVSIELGIDGFDSNDITLAVESVSLPAISNDPIELAYGNSKVKVAGQATFDDISLTVKDFIEADIEMALMKWRKQVYDPETDKMGWASQYKKDGTITQYGPDGSCLRKWKLQGIWPTTLDLGEMNYDGGDKKTITMTLSVDKANIVTR